MSLNTISSAFTSKENCSQILFDSRRRTANEGADLLEFLEATRVPLLELYSGKEINLEASEGNGVNGVHFGGELNKAIIFLHGNGSFYESAASRPIFWKESLKDVDGKTPHLVVFNPSGTGKSEGLTDPQTAAENLATIFKYLVDQGVDPNHIAIAGHSMGGYFSVFGAESIQSLYPESSINLLLDRSFWDLHSIVDSKVKKYSANKFSAVCRRPLLHAAIDEMRWARNSIKALESLKGRVCVVYHRKDGVVLYPNSFHAKLSHSERQRSYQCVEMTEEDSEMEAHGKYHNREYTNSENEQIIRELRIMLGMELDPAGSSPQTEILSATIKV